MRAVLDESRAKIKLLKRSWALLRHAKGQDISQRGEWTYLKELILADYPPYLVDVGAYDGVLSSNSFAFIQLGWKAVLIEPLPGPFRLLSKTFEENSTVSCVNKACSNSVGTQKLFLSSAGEMGMTATLCADDNQWFKRHRSAKSIEVQVDTLTNILTACAFPKDFSLLLIDTEGMDYEVLLGLDFRLFAPRIVVTEEYLWNATKYQAKCDLLENSGYGCLRVIGSNAIWVRH